MDTSAESNELPRGRFAIEVPDGLDLGLTRVRGLGKKTAEKLADRGWRDLSELLLLFPRRYRRTYRGVSVDRAVIEGGEYGEFVGQIEHVNPPPKHSRRPLEVTVNCGGTRVKLVWFNLREAWFIKKFEVGAHIVFEGALDTTRRSVRMMHPEFEVVGPEPDPVAEEITIEPVYPSFEGIKDPVVRRGIEHAVENVLPHARELVPGAVLKEAGLGSLTEAIRTLHVCDDVDLEEFEEKLVRSRERLVFEEFYLLQCELAREYVESRRAARAPVCDDREFARDFVRRLPFKLTGDQREVIATIADELASRIPMRRLLQGDVGSGKTVVAFMAAAIAIGSGQQVAVMAPTDVLASQHLARAHEFFSDFDVGIALLTGSISAAKRRQVLAGIADGRVKLVIGTHALFQDDVQYCSEQAQAALIGAVARGLGLVIVDEEHKFGVEQRQLLMDKGQDPHLLAMTATPIPRSLAHAVFGEFDLSSLREKPPGRKPIRTFLRDARSRDRVFEFVREKVDQGAQAYIVYPLVEESAAIPNRENVVDASQSLANGVLKGKRVGVLHGRMKAEEKLSVMRDFKAGLIDVLCSTTVIEVGVDVPNASLMVIEHAELFGLSQLHQLRGRVGRGESESICVVIAHGELTDDARARLNSFAGSDDGFALSEIDLEIRGPGLFLGARQSGAPEFRFGDILRDSEWLDLARRIARRRILGDAD